MPERGMDGDISKPVGLDKLREVVERPPEPVQPQQPRQGPWKWFAPE